MTTNDSLLILGRQPALGLAELESLYGADKVNSIRPNVAKLNLPLGDMDFLRLGGSTRLANPLAELPVSDWKLVEKFFISAVLDRLHIFKEGKLKIGVSVYGFNITPGRLTATTLTLKKAIRGKGRSVRVVPNQTLELNAAQLIHNGLVGNVTAAGEIVRKSGREFLLINTENGSTILAETILAQDIASYTLRDRGRPKRDARVGMLPPKLAQIIINLSAATLPPSTDTIVLDPFCGTGVVLQEALLMGYSAYGTDIDQRMVDYSIANVHDWFYVTNHPELKAKLTVACGDATDKVWEDDVWNKQKEDFDWTPAKINFVACETYLGQPFSSFPSREKLEQVRGTCNDVIEKFLANIGRQIKPGTRLCLAVPAWQEKPGQFIHLPLLDHLGDMGYNRVSFKHARPEELIYSREGQIVGRELLVITRK